MPNAYNAKNNLCFFSLCVHTSTYTCRVSEVGGPNLNNDHILFPRPWGMRIVECRCWIANFPHLAVYMWSLDVYLGDWMAQTTWGDHVATGPDGCYVEGGVFPPSDWQSAGAVRRGDDGAPTVHLLRPSPSLHLPLSGTTMMSCLRGPSPSPSLPKGP